MPFINLLHLDRVKSCSKEWFWRVVFLKKLFEKDIHNELFLQENVLQKQRLWCFCFCESSYLPLFSEQSFGSKRLQTSFTSVLIFIAKKSTKFLP